MRKKDKKKETKEDSWKERKEKEIEKEMKEFNRYVSLEECKKYRFRSL